MQEQDEARTVDRRRLLRRAGTIAVGAAGATATGAIMAAPAQAASTPVVTEVPNTGGDADTPTVRLENPAAGGSALSVKPGGPQSVAAPAGSVFVDEFGDFSAIGDDGQGKFVTYAYSPTWATMVVPIQPVRWLDTRTTAGRAHVVPGSAILESSGRVVPRNSNTTPDLILDLSGLFLGGFGAVQANLTVVTPAGQGWAALWDTGSFPGTSSINYATSVPALSNFTQTVIADEPTRRTIRFKTSQRVHFIFDIVGFVVADPSQLTTQTTMGTSAQSSTQRSAPSVPKRRPPAR